MKNLILSLLLALLVQNVFSQIVKTVEGEYTYYAPENVSLVEAKRYALKQARLNAIADKFGTIVERTNLTRVEDRNEHSNIHFVSLGSSDVKGEWIENVDTPSYEVSYVDGMLVVKCKVKGKAREMIYAPVDFSAKVLRNGTDDKFEGDQFKSGDELYLSFQSPTKGFLAVYLVGEDERVQCLLPYKHQQDGIYQVDANRRYVLFSERDAPQDYPDEYVMTAERSVEHNQLYVIFSPNQFVKAVDVTSDRAVNSKNISGFPRELSFEDFHKWLGRCRRHDKEMTLKKVVLTIKAIIKR